jgi:predicted nucleotidyltransferase component of viral defense system
MLAEPNAVQIRQAAIKLGIPAEFVRKDYFVTQAIHLLMQINNDYYALGFQGGTSLSKGYQLVQRLSEDVDFRVVKTTKGETLGKAAKRRELRAFRHAITNTLREAGFDLPDESVRVLYEGRYMRLNVSFDQSKNITYLKPHILIECFLGEASLPFQPQQITSLTKVTLGDSCQDITIPVDCVALDETAAEKWVALTRRIANSIIKERPGDKHLVRHLYDLYHLNKSSLLTGDYKKLISGLLKKDSEQFKKYNEDYNKHPVQTSKEALSYLFEDKKWQSYWDDFLMQMVYGDNKPSFKEACDSLEEMSQAVFSALELEDEQYEESSRQSDKQQ